MHNNANNQSKEIIMQIQRLNEDSRPAYERTLTLVETVKGKPTGMLMALMPSNGKLQPVSLPLERNLDPVYIYDTEEHAIEFLKQVEKVGLTRDIELTISPLDHCARCGRLRVSPYQEPSILLGICPSCRKAIQERIDNPEDTRRACIYWQVGSIFEYYDGLESYPDGTKRIKTSQQPVTTFADEWEACEAMRKLHAEGFRPLGPAYLETTEQCQQCGKIMIRRDRPRKRPLCDECNPRKKNARK